jgi:hypothetical protein
MGALSLIKEAGFDVTLVGDSFEVSPASSLTQTQREFLKLHKAEIVADLQGDKIVFAIITCYSPNGQAIEVEARNSEHAEFLQQMNPIPQR